MTIDPMYQEKRLYINLIVLYKDIVHKIEILNLVVWTVIFVVMENSIKWNKLKIIFQFNHNFGAQISHWTYSVVEKSSVMG